MKKIALLLVLATVAFGCNESDDSTPEVLGCMDSDSLNYNPDATTDDGSCVYAKTLTFTFTQNWGGTPVTSANFNNTEYTNEAANVLKISKLRYLISAIELHGVDSTLVFNDYKLVDLTDANSLSLTISSSVPTGDYTGISFVYGFNKEDNVSGAYPDLNAANWNWPAMLGGGYHFMQMEGTYKDTNGDTQPYAYHNGTARVSDGVFEQNFIPFDFNRNFTVSDDTTIEIKMDISEWYKNTYTWDLNVYNVDLMMNYDAQKHMHENGPTVFSIGEIK